MSCSCFFLLFNLLAVEAPYLLLIRICCISLLSFCQFWGSSCTSLSCCRGIRLLLFCAP